MIRELANGLLQKYPPESLEESVSWFRGLKRDWQRLEVWENLKYASEVARRDGQEVDHFLCRWLSDLFWAVRNGHADLISETLWEIFDLLDYPEEERASTERAEMYALCCLLFGLQRRETKGLIYFYSETQDPIQVLQVLVPYKNLLDLLFSLHGKALGDPLVFQVKEQVGGMKIPDFEKDMIVILLQDLEKPVEKE